MSTISYSADATQTHFSDTIGESSAAKFLTMFQNDFLARENSVILSWKWALIGTLGEIQRTNTEDHITNLTVDTATRFLKLLPDNIKIPDVFGEEQNKLVFEWNEGPDKLISIAIYDRSYAYAGIWGAKRGRDGNILAEKLPGGFLEYIQLLGSRQI